MLSLRSVDLNLLVILDALLIERHVSRAAVRLGMSQPAVSHALSRLRQQFDDELLVKHSGGYRLTALATSLGPVLTKTIEQIHSVFDSPVFDPSKSEKIFRVAMSDYGTSILLPRMIRSFEDQAPNVKVVVTHSSREEMIAGVMTGEIDLAIGVFPSSPNDLRSERLFEEHFVCVLDKNFPIGCKKHIDLETYLAASHISVSVRGDATDEVDSALRDLGHRRNVDIITPHFALAPQLVVGTRRILTIASRMMESSNTREELRVVPPPFEIPNFDFVQVWHERNEVDDAMRWFRRSMIAAASP